jgi:ubiquinone biosynthesis monooxygenase Coq7
MSKLQRAPSTLSDILRVNHAGELGAIKIYQGQRIWARSRARDLLPWLDRMLSEENTHKAVFARLMRERSITPCWMLNAWGLGGWILGVVTGAFGRSAILISTIAIERTVHGHLNDQLAWLADRDAEISGAIRAIAVEEAEHLESAKDSRPQSDGAMGALDGIVANATEALIWLSTYGASARTAKRIAA